MNFFICDLVRKYENCEENLKKIDRLFSKKSTYFRVSKKHYITLNIFMFIYIYA